MKDSDKTVDMFIRGGEKEAHIKKFFMEDVGALLEKYAPGDPSFKPDVLAQIKVIEADKERIIKEYQEQMQQAGNNGQIMMQNPGQPPRALSPAEVVQLVQMQQHQIKDLLQKNEDLEKKLKTSNVLPNDKLQSRIKELENLDVLDVSCGGEHSVFRIGLGDDSNAIYSCGSNAYGQLCHKMDSSNDQNCFFYEPVYSKQLKEVGRSISQIECAGESTLFLFSNYIPSTLKEICTTIIQQNPDKYSEQHHFKNIKELANYYEIVSKE
jgi:hypothetical protein